MKFTINIDCTPEEARDFLGLPDTEELQKKFFEHIQQNLQNPLMGSEEMMKFWSPESLENISDIQKMMWEQIQKMSNPKKD